jgi:hypothetical protein
VEDCHTAMGSFTALATYCSVYGSIRLDRQGKEREDVVHEHLRQEFVLMLGFYARLPPLQLL